jgi:RNA polymerase sigma factor (sigma-70 family)
MAELPPDPAVPSDADLIARSREGDSAAFSTLYDRHAGAARAAAMSLTKAPSDADDLVAEAFTRVLATLRRGGGPQLAFRPYLLTTVRNAYYDRVRRDVKVDAGTAPPEAVTSAAVDAVTAEDARLVAEAFATLPERWQVVLWHTEVEGRGPAEVAPLLGIAPSAVAALSYRAREGLRQAYLQAHLQAPAPERCREAVSRLGAYVRDGLAERDRRAVDAHLAGCASCRVLLGELQEEATTLRGALLPVLVGIPAVAYLGHLGSGATVTPVVPRPRWRPRSPKQALVTGAVAAAAVALIVAGIFTLTVQPGTRVAGIGPPSTVAPVEPGDEVTGSSAEPGVPGSVDTTSALPSSPGVAASPAAASSPSSPLPPTGSPAPSAPGVQRPVLGPPAPVRTTPLTTARRAVATTAAARAVATTAARRAAAAPNPAAAPTTAAPSTTGPAPSTTRAAATTSAPAATTTSPTLATPDPPPPAPTNPPPPVLDVALGGFVGPVMAGGRTYVRVGVANQGPGSASGATVELALPPAFVPAPGFGSARRAVPLLRPVLAASPAGWSCAPTPAGLRCTLPRLNAGERTVEVVPFDVAATAQGTVELEITVNSPAGSVSASPITAPILDAGGLGLDLFLVDRGDIALTGNSLLSCPEKAPGCLDARAGAKQDNNDFDMVAVDMDANPDTAISSTADLALPDGATVLRALLVWGADVPKGATDALAVAHLHSAGGDRVVKAARTSFDGANRYRSMADVTDIVGAQGAGTYTVGGIAHDTGVNTSAGWALVVAFRAPGAPLRAMALSLLGGALDASSPDAKVTLPGLPVSPATSRLATLGLVVLDGDLGSAAPADQSEDESVALDGVLLADGTNPAGNPFNSTVTGPGRQPADANALGFDADVFSAAVSGLATAPQLRLRSAIESISPVVAFLTVEL